MSLYTFITPIDKGFMKPEAMKQAGQNGMDFSGVG